MRHNQYIPEFMAYVVVALVIYSVLVIVARLIPFLEKIR